ncbi:XTP/dITP diphosphatase [Aerococcaceae bacterium WGS1372]
MKIIIASHNKGKVNEFNEMFKELNIEVVSLIDYPEIDEVEETGDTFEANARLKAETIAEQLGQMTLADDSGLVVPALNGEPGIYSARYAGEDKDDRANNQKLLEKMKSLRGKERQAYFNSTLVLAYPNHESLVVEGRVDGVILDEERGHDGFGYDPLFYYPPLEKSFGELTLEAKNNISHRSRAMDELNKQINKWLEGLELYENDVN